MLLRPTLRCAALCALLPALLPAHAEEAIVTDRPDFVESSDVVGAGRFQVETGLQLERNKQDGVKERAYATPTLLRYGIGETLELRLESDGLLRARSEESGVVTKQNGTADASIGMKWHIADGDAKTGSPGMALLLHADLDSGSAAFRGTGVRPSLRGVAEFEHADDWSSGWMAGLVADRDAEGRHFTAGILAVTVGKGFTDELRGFVELAGQQLASKKHGGNVATFDGGIAYLVNDDVQLDLSFAIGLNRNTPDLAWGVGLSFRL